MNKYLKEVDDLISDVRRKDYGSIKDNMRDTNDIFEVMTEMNLSVEESILFMVAHKLAREKYKHKKDNIIDAIGYLVLYLEEAEKESNKEVTLCE